MLEHPSGRGWQLVARTGHPDFLDLPWDEPLEEWTNPRLRQVPRGLSRHIVRFVAYDDRLYALKELPRHYAEREYRLLRRLAEEQVPAVEVVGVVSGRATDGGEPIDAILITQHLEYSLPYRVLFAREEHRALRDPLLDALVDLLVRLHLTGFFWGDCSLSNTLFRRDAGALAAYLVDAETGELHDALTDGQREHDIDLAVERCSGELFDLQASGTLAPDVDVLELGDELRRRYAALWTELTREELINPDERYRIEERLRRINELGYDVGEVELLGGGEERRLSLRTRVVEPGHHRRRLQRLVGLDVQENQARHLLNDIASYGAWLQGEEGRTLLDPVVAHRWLEAVFEPVISAIPTELQGRRAPAELVHEVLWHRQRLSEEEQRDVPLVDATLWYVERVLSRVPEERALVGDDEPDLG